MSSLFKYLKDRKIINILIGDTQLAKPSDSFYNEFDTRMNYLSGPKICKIAERFGCNIDYYNSNKRYSRWQYMEKLIIHCAENNSCSDLLVYLFSKENFPWFYQDGDLDEIFDIYKKICWMALIKINCILELYNVVLIKKDNIYVMEALDTNIVIDTNNLNKISRDYIIQKKHEINDCMKSHKFDSAISLSRTLLEEIFYYILEDNDNFDRYNGDMQKLYKEVRNVLNLNNNEGIGKSMNKLFSGMNNIVQAIGELRNSVGDSHGLGSNREVITENDALLAVNSTFTLAEYLIPFVLKNIT